MGDTCKAIQVTRPGGFEIIDIPMPRPLDDEMLIELRACSTCTNWELKTWAGVDIFGRPGHPIYPQNPGSPGHEAAGTVVECGANVTTVKAGDHVAIMGSVRGPENDAHAQFVARPEAHVALLSPSVSFVDAAPLEMVMCAVRSLTVAGDVSGKSVAVVGLGPAGNFHVQLARHGGAARCIGIDTVPARLNAARPFADLAVSPTDGDALAQVRADGVDIAFDCSGSPAGMRLGLDLAREVCYVFAVPEGEVGWGKMDWLSGTALVPYNWRGDSPWSVLRRAAALLGDGAVDARAVITHVLPYTRYAEAMDLLASRQAIKIVFEGWE